MAGFDRTCEHRYAWAEGFGRVLGEEGSMGVSLTPEIERLILEKVESGLYLSANEVLHEALRLLEERDKVQAMKLEELRKEIRIGLDQADRGELLDGPEVFESLRTKVRGMGGSGGVE
jgi:antitoxin ParD1/3/4